MDMGMDIDIDMGMNMDMDIDTNREINMPLGMILMIQINDWLCLLTGNTLTMSLFCTSSQCLTDVNVKHSLIYDNQQT